MLFILRRDSSQQVGRSRLTDTPPSRQAYRGTLKSHVPHLCGKEDAASSQLPGGDGCSATDADSSRAVSFGQLNLFITSSSSHTLPCSRTALKASDLCSAEMLPYHAACGRSHYILVLTFQRQEMEGMVHRITQIHREAGVGRDLCRPFNSTPLLEQDHLE